MSYWRKYKKYYLNSIEKFNNNNYVDIQKSFNKESTNIMNDKKLTWKKRAILMHGLKKSTLRKINRFDNNNNINYDLDDVEAFNEPTIFEQLKCIKINEPNDLNGFYQFIITKDIPKDQPVYKDNGEPIEEFIFKCESEQQIKRDLKKFLKHIKFH